MKNLLMLSIILLLISGCSDSAKISIYHVDDDQEEIEALENVLQDNQKLSEAAGVFFDHQLAVSLQVKPMSKFNKEKIKKSVEKEVQAKFPNHDVFVSSDLKITWELMKIIEERPIEKELEEDLAKLQSLAKEET